MVEELDSFVELVCFECELTALAVLLRREIIQRSARLVCERPARYRRRF